MSYNVFKGRPIEKPEAFARIFRALSPDIVLLQEWDKGDANEVKAWFVTLIPSGSGWQAVRPAGGDVAIVSRYPLALLGPDSLQLPASGGQPHNIRFVAATATTPAGEVVVGDAHLKCCGGFGGPEEATRMAEAQAINAALKQALTGKGGTRVIGGDLNLVATRAPLDVLAAGLDTGGGNLGTIAAPVLGDPGVFFTWSDPATDFAPGRLDYLLLSESAATGVQAFVLDTSRLSDAVLSRHGLRRDDTRQSDHFPVVADILPRTP
jgi:endonuclease/exonuclease/phosphatase family metal-dependent hydrolase